jgi:ribonuclease inhibitor
MPLKKREYELDGKAINCMADFYLELGKQLPLPSYFGDNLDALWDFLTTDLQGPCKLVWLDSEHSRTSMGDDFKILVKIFEEVSEEREEFLFVLR